jgi:hypothetical protein
MAQINGKDVSVQLSSDSGTTWKTLICEIDHTFSLTRETSSVFTKCDSGTATVSLGAYSWQVTGNAVADTAPGATEVSYEDMLGWAQAGTSLMILMEHDAAGGDFTESGTGYITSLERTAGTVDPIQFSFTFSGTGALDITA